MKKAVILLLLVACCGFTTNAVKWVKWKDKSASVPTPAKYESFENGVPDTWTLQGQGKLSINPWHYKLGKKSLQWDFKPGDFIKINNTIGDPARRGGRANIEFACFGVWVYVKEPMPGKNLRFEFRTDEKKDAYFDFPLNYSGWQCGFVCYHGGRYLKGKVSTSTNNLIIKAPKDSSGRVLIDLLVYNGPRYSMFANIIPNETPWAAPVADNNNPVPARVTGEDLKTIEKIKSELLKPINISDKGKGAAAYDQVMKNIKELDIVEDAHGIRGKPINVTRDHGGGEWHFYTYLGIPFSELESFNDAILVGDRRNKWKKGILTKVSKAVEQGLTHNQYDKLCKANVMLWKFLLDQGFNTSYGYGNYYSGTNTWTAAAIYQVRDAVFKSGLMPQVFQYAQYKMFPLFVKGKHIISMDNFANSASLYYLAFLYSQDTKKQIQALRAIKKRLDVDITKDYGACGFKPDGCGYHCTDHGGGYTRGGLRGIAKVARVLHGSSFALSEEAFNVLKKCAMCFYFYSNNCDVPIFMQGTSPIKKTHPAKYQLKYLHVILKDLALAGKNGCDRELAQAYVNLKDAVNKSKPMQVYGKYDPVFETKYGIKPGKLPQGSISMPYMPIVAQRRAGWLAVASGARIDMRDRGNQYGYHMGNGPLSIIGKDGFHASGTEEYGWDWNRTNGATVLYMPDIINIKYIHGGRKKPAGYKKLAPEWFDPKIRIRARRDDPVIKRGDGGISWRGINGSFRKIFYGDRLYNNFWGIKSYFFINDRIYALGSNISSYNKKYHVQTNLYQKALYKSKVTGRKWTQTKQLETPTFVDGKEITAFPVADKMLSLAKPHYLVDTVGTGYFVPAGQKVLAARKHQKSRTSTSRTKHVDHAGDFATAWLDHGIACKDAKYSYVIMPYCDKARFAKFSSKDFEILRQDDFAHIIHDKIDGFYAGIFFRGGDVKKLPHVSNVERDCQIMYRQKAGKLEIAVGDPDVHRHYDKMFLGSYGGRSKLIPLKVTFAGAWKLVKPVNGVKIISGNKNKTVIEFASIHGRDFNFTLTK